MGGKKWLYLVLAFACLAGILWFMPTSAVLKPAAKASLAIAVFAIIVWVTQALDDALSALVIVFLLAALKATDLAGSFAGYSRRCGSSSSASSWRPAWRNRGCPSESPCSW
jgi:di/tricarboxylate transporter